MAGVIEIRPDLRWSAASWLYEWALLQVATATSDADLKENIESVISNNIGWFGLLDLPPVQRSEVKKILQGDLMVMSRAKLPLDMPERERVLRVLQQLAHMAST